VYTDAEGHEVQPLAGMHESAFAFYDGLTDEQQAALYQGEEVSTLVCASGGICDYPTGTGIAGAELTEEQEELLLEVIAQWVGLSDEQITAEALAEIEASLDETSVNWSGADVDGYTTAGWGHVHSIYRDPANDYAGSVTPQEASGTGGPGGGAAPVGDPPANG
jgi:hypothetical protein